MTAFAPPPHIFSETRGEVGSKAPFCDDTEPKEVQGLTRGGAVFWGTIGANALSIDLRTGCSFIAGATSAMPFTPEPSAHATITG